MNSAQIDPKFSADLADGWRRRTWARTGLTALVCTGIIIISGTAGSLIGYFLFSMVAAVCLFDLLDSRRRLTALSKGPLSDWLALHQRQLSTLRVSAWAGYVPALATLSKFVRHPARPEDGFALAFFVGAALFIQLVLLRRGK